MTVWWETDQASPAGLWRAQVQGNAFKIEKNTAAARDWSTVQNPLLLDGLELTVAGDLHVGGRTPFTGFDGHSRQVLEDSATTIGVLNTAKIYGVGIAHETNMTMPYSTAFWVLSEDTGGTKTATWGGQFDAYNHSAIARTSMAGLFSQAVNGSGGGAVTSLFGFHTQTVNSAASAVTNAYGIHIDENYNTGGGTITNSYGLRILDHIAGVNNWALRTGLGLVQFGDRLVVDGAINVGGNVWTSYSAANQALFAEADNTLASLNIATKGKGTVIVSQTNSNENFNYGLYVAAEDTGGTKLTLIGAEFDATHASAGTLTTLMGAFSQGVTNLGSGAVTNLTGLGTHTVHQAVTTVATAIGISIDENYNTGGGTITNSYGLKIEDHVAGTNDWAIRTGLGLVQLGDRLIAAAPDSAIADATLAASSWSAYLNEAGNVLTFKVKYAGGTVKTGTVALT